MSVVHQSYQTDVYQEYAIRGNSVIFKCQFPSFVADHLVVESWTIDDVVSVTPSDGIDPAVPFCHDKTHPPLLLLLHCPSPAGSRINVDDTLQTAPICCLVNLTFLRASSCTAGLPGGRRTRVRDPRQQCTVKVRFPVLHGRLFASRIVDDGRQCGRHSFRR